MITEYVGYNACSLANPEDVAKSSFGIVSYIAHTLPHVECVHALCGHNDLNGLRLASSFAKGLVLHSLNDVHPSGSTNLQDAILDLILSNIYISDSTLDLNLSLMIIGLGGGSKHNCFTSILELISDVDFVLNPRTSSTATKCFELLYRVYELGNTGQGLPPHVQRRQQLWLNKLRHASFWQAQVALYLGMQGPSTPSSFHEICNSYRYGRGDDAAISQRDNDVLHSVAWLLRGLALEIQSLVGQQIDGSSMILGDMIQSTAGKSRHQLQSLLEHLFSPGNQLLLTALIDMPLGHASSGFIQERLHMIPAPSGDALKNSSMPMRGPVDVCAGYDIVDIERLLAQTQAGSQRDSAREWATAWNSYVSRVCSCSNITDGWSDVVKAALVCSPFRMNTRSIMDLLCTVLSRILTPSHLDALSQYGVFPSAGQAPGNVESECAMPLSSAALCLTELLIESCLHDVSGADEVLADSAIAEEDVTRVSSLIVGAISSCNESGSSNDERAAVLSCALTRMLDLAEGASVFSQANPSILNLYADAIMVLLRLSAAPVFDAADGKYFNTHQAKVAAIALAARSGVTSLFGHLKLIGSDGAARDFCSKIFTQHEISASIAKLVHLITENDNDVAFLLQQIAQFHDGVQLLARAGVTSKLLEYANKYALDEHSFLSSHMGTNDAAQLKPPSLLNGHLSLLNSLLSSPLSTTDQVALAADSYQLLKLYCGTVERLAASYPANSELLIKFVEALYLTYGALKDSSEMNAIASTLVQVDDASLALERVVLRIAYQFSAYPFPGSLLPPLPTNLVNVEQIHSSQMKNISIDTSNESTWWDNVPKESALKGSQPLPLPPVGSFDVVSSRYTSYKSGAKPAWSEKMYQYSISSAKCLEMSVMFLINRVNFVTKRDLPTFCIDPVAIAKGLCRCSDASMVSEDWNTD